MKIKKLKKILVGALSAAMVMSTMAVTAFAEGPDTILQDTGSLTINKYEGSGTTTPLEGVEFTMYKIADITQTVNNGVVDTKVTPIDAIADDLTAAELTNIANGETSSAEWASLLGEITLEELNVLTAPGDKHTGTTDENGQVVFSDVPIGIYAVAETNAPSQVISRTANFIVSIPMTTDNGDSWNYDVIANPKNTTAYGGISLLKKGKTGNGSASALEGVEFKLQKKINDVWTTIQENLTTNSDGIITVDNLTPASYRFVEVNLGDNKGYILDGKTTYDFDISISEGVTHIYYDANKDGTKEDQGTTAVGYTINALNEKPTLEKKVKDGTEWDDETDASIGDTVTWKVTASVPSKVNELKLYSLKDTMSSALTWVSAEAAQLTITTSPELAPAAALESTDYTLTVPADGTEGGSWEITFTDAGKGKLAANNVTSIDVTFNTVLNANAKVGSDGNLNTGELDYSNAIYPTTDPRTPGRDVITDQAIVYTFALNVVKVDGKTSTPLAGVTFDLYSYDGPETNVTETTLANGTRIKVAQNGEGVGKYVVDKVGSATLTTDSTGNIVVNGLKNGNYYLVETKTNDGYNLLKKPVKVVISVTYETKTETVTETDIYGNTTSTTTVTTKTFTGGENNTGTYKIQVQNNKGFQLPQTGGAGTLLASLIGILLMMGGAFLFISSRKTKKRNNP